MRGLGAIILGAVMLFLTGPFVVILLAALSAGETLAFPPLGLSLFAGPSRLFSGTDQCGRRIPLLRRPALVS